MKNILALSALSAFIASAAAWDITIYQNADYNQNTPGWSKKWTYAWNSSQKIFLSGKHNDGTSSFIFNSDRNNLKQSVNSITLYEHYDANGNCYGQIGYSCGSWAVNRVSAVNNDKLSCIHVKYHVVRC
ncbi:hypothetical protein BGZ94_009311 [Podila epigama]|nr:hypothetical protein BGZ94_009311 [Podila epigama]